MVSGSGMLIRQYAYDQARKNPGKEVKILSERELCKVYNVSRPTVRKSLDELVLEKMLIIRKGHGTFTNPSTFKEHYLPGSKLSVGIIVGSGKNIVYDCFFWDIISEAGKVICDDFGDIRLIQTVNDNEKIIEEILLLNLDALIWIHPTNERTQVIEAIQAQGIPVMCVNRMPSGVNVNYVSTDFYAAGRAAGTYLLDNGHKKILFIAVTAEGAYQEFYRGYCDVLSEHKIVIDEHLMISQEDAIIPDINNLMRFKIPFTACFAMGIYIWTAIEALKAAYGDNFRDNCELLTTYSSRGEFLDCPYVNINPSNLGRMAALELKDMVTSKRKTPVKIKLIPEIISNSLVSKSESSDKTERILRPASENAAGKMKS
ncbi:MAG: substrate-binding domain-containing protein [Victivallaceae bacterium]